MAIYRWKKYAISIDESSYAMSKGPISGYVFGYGADRQDTILVYVTANKPAIVNDAYDFSKARTNYVSPTSYASLTDTLWFSFEDRAPTTMYKLQSAGTLGWMSDYGVYTVVQPYVYTLSETVGEFIEYVYSETSSAYPNGGISGSYYYSERTEITDPVLTVPSLAMQSAPLVIEWTAINDDTATYVLERKADSGEWAQIYSGANLTYTDTIGTWSTVQYRVKAGVSGVHGDYTTSEAISVVSASALVISGTDSDLGTLTAPVGYSVSSDTGNTITVTEEVNGVALRTYTATSGQQQSIAIPDLPTGSGSITIKASVQATAGTVNQTRNWTYTKTAPTFPSGPFDISTLSKGGKTQFPLTLAECVKMPMGHTLDELEKYWWKRVAATINIGTESAKVFSTGSTTSASTDVYCSDTISVSNGIVTLVNPVHVDIAYNQSSAAQTALRGKYFVYRENNGQVYFVPSDAVISPVDQGSGVNWRYGLSIECSAVTVAVGNTEYISSSDRNEYPDDGYVDGYSYKFMGTPMQNAINALTVVGEGAYLGTGTFGESNPNSLTFSTLPEILLIFNETVSGIGVIFINNSFLQSNAVGKDVNVSGNDTILHGCTAYAEGTTVFWYYSSGASYSQASYQANSGGAVYYYLALGKGGGGGNQPA